MIMPLEANISVSVILNFGFGLLEFIWELDFGAWNFHGFRKADNFFEIIRLFISIMVL